MRIIPNYILTKITPKYSGFEYYPSGDDFSLLLESAYKTDLEEILLSVWEENEYEMFNYWLADGYEFEIAMTAAKMNAEEFTDMFQINPVYDINDIAVTKKFPVESTDTGK